MKTPRLIDMMFFIQEEERDKTLYFIDRKSKKPRVIPFTETRENDYAISEIRVDAHIQYCDQDNVVIWYHHGVNDDRYPPFYRIHCSPIKNPKNKAQHFLNFYNHYHRKGEKDIEMEDIIKYCENKGILTDI